MNEKALLFGSTKSLAGVVTDPNPAAAHSLLGVIILNAGVLHRVGPNRIHVRLARALAERGFVVLRFDLSGIGDSRRRDGSESFARAAVQEVQQAMDFLAESRGIERFVLFGICSGADNGLRVSHSDPRVAGAALIDGYNLPSLGLLLQFYQARLLSVRSWMRFLIGRSETWSLIRSLASAYKAGRNTGTSEDPILPSRTEFLTQMRSVADRGVELLLIYTGTSPAYYNYRRLLRRRLRSWPSRARVRVEHFQDSDHLFTLLANQRRLVELVTGWAAGLTGAGPPRSYDS